MYDIIAEHAGWIKPTDVECIVKLEGVLQETNFTNHQLPALETASGGYEREPIDAAQQFHALYHRSAHEWLVLNGLTVTDDVTFCQRTDLINMLMDIQRLDNIDVLQLVLAGEYDETEFLIGALMEQFGYGRAVEWYDAFDDVDATFEPNINKLAEEPEDAITREERQSEIIHQFRNHINVAANGRYKETPIVDIARTFNTFPVPFDATFDQISANLETLGDDELGFNLYGLAILADIDKEDRVPKLQVIRADLFTDKVGVDLKIVEYHDRRMEV